ncbi:unnamed protein product [Mycena citricolor]|uniref:Calcineurin-like phosphoesterase domain-containing protein n=2 Tax=Mycena citricolor TaxID=2018698 RepID=A0AAD2HVA7_9AGAR|nr:unnamed protein product [Mycena citricolor]
MHILSRPRFVVESLRLLWLGIAVWYEHIVFLVTIRRCSWPDSDTLDSPPSHVLIVADPQILDHRSYPDRGLVLTYISQFLVDLNLRKSWRASLKLKPDVVVFLGDMMDGGRFAMSDAEYERYFRRFKSIFACPSTIPQHYIPGNHDTGLGASEEFSEHAKERYISHFGPLNHHEHLANHTLVFLDGPSLAEEERLRPGRSYFETPSTPSGPIEFTRSFSASAHSNPIVLFTHIPLHRPDGSSCGPHRERGSIRRGFGFGYQNTLSRATSDFLLQSLEPAVIFSGDDHDYCEHTHSFVNQGKKKLVREVTVKSPSMAMGIRHPGVQLLSLGPSTHNDALCLLPDQLGIYLSVYLPLLVLSLALVLFANLRRVQTRNERASPLRYNLGRSSDDYPRENLPNPGSHKTRLKKPILSQSFVIFGQRRRIDIHFSSIYRLATCCYDSQGVPRLRGFWMGVLVDVKDVAVVPLAIFSILSWWMFR